MNASRGRGGVLVAALVILVAVVAISPPMRPYARHVLYGLGIVHLRPPIAAGQPLGSVKLVAMDGSPVELLSRPGRSLLINVFATWCGPCRDEAPMFAAAAPNLARAGIDVVGVDQAESPAQIERFAQTFGLHYPIYVGDDSATRAALDARVIPTTLFVDAKGVVRSIHVGPLDPGELVAMSKLNRDRP